MFGTKESHSSVEYEKLSGEERLQLEITGSYGICFFRPRSQNMRPTATMTRTAAPTADPTMVPVLESEEFLSVLWTNSRVTVLPITCVRLEEELLMLVEVVKVKVMKMLEGTSAPEVYVRVAVN